MLTKDFYQEVKEVLQKINTAITDDSKDPIEEFIWIFNKLEEIQSKYYKLNPNDYDTAHDAPMGRYFKQLIDLAEDGDSRDVPPFVRLLTSFITEIDTHLNEQESNIKEHHTAERVDNLMYKGCEPHWQCTKCGKAVPFHCYTKEEFENQCCGCHKVNCKDCEHQ